MKRIIKNATIFTQNENRDMIEKGYLITQDENIIEIGPMDQYKEIPMDAEIIEGDNYLITPGFINAHTHVTMTLLRGYADDLPLWTWLSEKMWPQEDKLTNEDAYWGSLLSIIEMIKSGTTTFNDMYMFMDKTAQAVKESGIRACLSRGLQGPDDKSLKRLEENKLLYRQWHNEAQGRIKIMAGPHAVYTCEPSYWEELLNMVQEFNMGIHTHLSETRIEVENCQKAYGKSPVQHMLEMGVFQHPVVAAHGVHLTDVDIEILKNNPVSIVYNPGSNLKLGSGLAPIPKLLDKGVNIALGTDGAASNNNLDLLEEIRLAALLHKGFMEDSTVITAQQALDMATIGGSKALSWKKIGSLEVGKRADLTMLSMKESTFYPKFNLMSHLVYSSHSSQVENVMVNGNWILRNKELTMIDEEKVIFHIEKIKNKFQ